MIDIHAIARHYGGEVSGGQALIPAIGHSARDRGVAVRAADDAPDGCLVHCFNGGDPLAEKDRLRADSFLPPLQSLSDRIPWTPPRRDTAPPPEHAVGLGPGQKIVATFEFQAADGALLYRKHRIEPGPDGRSKSFQYDRPNGKGGWVRGAGEDRVPYRLPDLLTAPRDLPIYMAEGEAKADKLASWGLLATSHKDWKSFEFSGYVKGRRVIILPDNDDTGRTQAQKAREAVETAEGKAVILELPGLTDGGDILDWEGTAADLRRLGEAVEADGLIELDDAAEWLAIEVPPRRWLLDGWFPVGEGGLWTGAGAVGKSLSTQQLAVCVATGVPFLGAAVTQAPSVYISCEDSKEELQRRFQAIVAQLGAHVTPGQCMMRSWKGEPDLELAVFDKDQRMRPTSRFQALRRTVLASGARLVILDNTSHLFGGDENVKREVAAFANLLNGLSAEIDGVVLILGHPNKTGLNNPAAGDANQFGGSVGWENQFRSRVFQSAPQPEEDPDYREISNPKANYSPKGNKVGFRWWRGAFVRDDDLPPDSAREIAETIRFSGANQRFKECLAKVTEQQENVSHSPSAGNYAPKRFAAMAAGKGFKRKDFEGAMHRLLDLGEIKANEPVFQYPNRTWAKGLKLVDPGAQNPAQNPAQKPREGSTTAPSE